MDKFMKYLPDYGIEPIVVAAKAYQERMNPNSKVTMDFASQIEVHQCPSFGWSFFTMKFINRVPGDRYYNLLKILSLPERCIFVPDYFAGWMPYAIRKAQNIVEHNRIEAVLTSSPTESTHLVGLALKRRFGLRWIADFRDLWTAKELVYRPATPLHDWYIRRLERKIMSEADHIIANTDENKEYYLEHFSLAENKVTVIPNGFDREDLDAIQAQKRADNVFSIGYMGVLNKRAFPWKLLLEGIRQLTDRVSPGKVRFVLCGPYGQEVRDFVRANGMEEIVVAEGTKPHVDAMHRIAQTDVQVVLLYDTDDSKSVVPMKLYNYLIMKGPILALAPEAGAVARVIGETRSGDVVAPNRSADDVCQVLFRYYRSWDRGEAIVRPDEQRVARYDRQTHVGELSEILLGTV